MSWAERFSNEPIAWFQSSKAGNRKGPSLLEFARRMQRNWQAPSHIRQIAELLEKVESGEIKRLIVNLPPRHGKTELITKIFPLWCIGRNPDRRFIIAAYGQDLTKKASRRLKRRLVTREFQDCYPGIMLAKDAQSVDEWDVQDREGGVKAVSVGSGVTGHGGNFLIVDDPHKGRKEADSEVERENVWEWYTGEAYTRLEPNPLEAGIIIVNTRWHEDDLPGRLLAKQEGEYADKWTVLNLPALECDEQGKESGPLWPERFPLAAYLSIKANDRREWQAQYMGRPTPPEGQTILRKWFCFVDTLPAGLNWVRYWDLAYTTKTSSDYTASVKLAIDPYTHAIYIADAFHARMEWPDVRECIVNTCLQDGKDVLCAVEKNGTQVTMVQELLRDRRLMGHAIVGSDLETDKYTRAMAWAGVAAQTGIYMLKGPWNEDLIEECIRFPLAAHDDLVDGVSGAFRVAIDTFNDKRPAEAIPTAFDYQRSVWKAMQNAGRRRIA